MIPIRNARPILTVAVASIFAHVHAAVCAQRADIPLLTMEGHDEPVKCVVFSPDGTRLASASCDGTVKIRDATTGKETFAFKGHAEQVWSVAFGPGGKWIASAGWDRTVKLWDPATGKVSLTLKHPDAVYCMAVSPDGKRVATGSRDKRVRVWDTGTGQNLLTLNGHTIGVVSVAFSPDGKRLASGASDDRTVNLWDVETGTRELLKLRHGGAWSLAFSPDGKRLATSGYISPVTVWNVATRTNLLTHGDIDSDDWFHCVTIRPDGKLLAAAGGTDDDGDGGIIVLWDLASGDVSRRLRIHSSDVRSLAFSPDGKRLAAGDDDGTITVWDVSD